jgi:hypothetical protein
LNVQCAPFVVNPHGAVERRADAADASDTSANPAATTARIASPRTVRRGIMRVSS